MSPIILFSFVIGYFVLLLTVAWYTSRNSNNESFFIGNRNSNWMLVAFGMIGTSLSGVTFVSVPGGVGTGNFYTHLIRHHGPGPAKICSQHFNDNDGANNKTQQHAGCL